MAKNPFKVSDLDENNLKRNAFPHSRQNLFTTEWGRLDPIFIQEVVPGSTVKIKSATLAVQAMPTVFPLQTPIRASVEFYYCRNRCVMDDWEDFIFRTKDVVAPYLAPDTIEKKKAMFKSGSLSDFFGFPTTIGSSTGGVSLNFSAFGRVQISGYRASLSVVPDLAFFSSQSDASFTDIIKYHPSDVDHGAIMYLMLNDFPDGFFLTSSSRLSVPLFNSAPGQGLPNLCWFLYDLDKDIYLDPVSAFFQVSESLDYLEQSIAFPSDFIDYFNTHRCRICIGSYRLVEATGVLNKSRWLLTYGFISDSDVTADWSRYSISNLRHDSVIDATDDSVLSSHPVVGSNPTMKVSSLPYRHYTMIANYFYRNDRNNPYYLNGEAQYNEFIPTHGSGADTNLYDFHYQDWELDRFTSSVQSPQFGEAPLVGLTYVGNGNQVELQFSASVDGGEPETVTALVALDSDDKIEKILDFDDKLPSANLRKLQTKINAGISINELRVTNAFQRFLENCQRHGLRYRSQLKSHFGVNVDFPDIDVPQYIGGFSGFLNVQKTTNMAETEFASLGDFNGQLQGVIESRHSVQHFCHEHGFIIGIAHISPMPVYSQAANKALLKTDPFDYFVPEFGKIGFVPMHYSEVMPLQTSSGQSVDDVFAYQKAWYDYMMSYDEAHCDFRLSLKDFVLQRTFAQRPNLTSDFTEIHPEQLNDVFVVQNTEHDNNSKFLCNFSVDCDVVHPIPMHGTPSLE